MSNVVQFRNIYVQIDIPVEPVGRDFGLSSLSRLTLHTHVTFCADLPGHEN